MLVTIVRLMLVCTRCDERSVHVSTVLSVFVAFVDLVKPTEYGLT
jgi:hypothetical protein